MVCEFSAPTNDTRVITKAVCSQIDAIYAEGVRFYKCGVGALELIDASHYQPDMFVASQDNKELMGCLDFINNKYGRNTMYLAAQGVEQKFAMRRAFLSPQYTTRVSDIPVIHCI